MRDPIQILRLILIGSPVGLIKDQLAFGISMHAISVPRGTLDEKSM
jgi:hypothetical protein